MSAEHKPDLTGEISALRPFLYRLAVLQLKDPTAAEDAAQEAVVSALQSKDRFSGRSSLKTWLVSVLRFKIIDILRERKRMAPLIGGSALEDELQVQDFDVLFDETGCWAANKDPWTNPQTNVERMEFFQILEACLDNLPENTSRVFLMREWLDLKSDEICSRAGVTPGNLRVLLYRARMQLRLCLEKNWGDAQ